jgi:hypothetical protein
VRKHCGAVCGERKQYVNRQANICICTMLCVRKDDVVDACDQITSFPKLSQWHSSAGCTVLCTGHKNKGNDNSIVPSYTKGSTHSCEFSARGGSQGSSTPSNATGGASHAIAGAHSQELGASLTPALIAMAQWEKELREPISTSASTIVSTVLWRER